MVLGSAAGGGFPQWNSNGPGCRRARAGDPAAPSRTQASLAVSGDGEHWYLLNAAPDLRQQIERTADLHPRAGPRHSPIAGVVLTGGDVDVIAGLLTLRERQPLAIHATAAVHGILDGNPVFEVLARDVVARPVETLDVPFALAGGLSANLFAVPGKAPLYMEEGEGMQPVVVDGTTVGLEIAHGRARMIFIPGCAAFTPALAKRLDGVDVVFFDGTLWRDDEMMAAGAGTKSGFRMGHMSLSGPEGTIAAFRSIAADRRILIHMNNTNPVLLADSAERAEAEAAGWEIGYDGMRLEL